MRKYLELVRIENIAIGVLGFCVAVFVAIRKTACSIPEVILGCAIVVLFIAGGNSLNDYLDRETDKISHPNRPLPSGRINPKIALILSLVFLTSSCALALLWFRWDSILIVVFANILLAVYEVFLKKKGFTGNIVIATLTGMVFLLGGTVGGNIECVAEFAAMAMVVTVGREITKDIEDMEGDEDRKTLPMSMGKKGAGVVASMFYIVGIILSMVPVVTYTVGMLCVFVVIADVILIHAARVCVSNPHESQKSSKAAMAVALAAYCLGVI